MHATIAVRTLTSNSALLVIADVRGWNAGNCSGVLSFASSGFSEDFHGCGTSAFFSADSPGGEDTSDPGGMGGEFRVVQR